MTFELQRQADEDAERAGILVQIKLIHTLWPDVRPATAAYLARRGDKYYSTLALRYVLQEMKVAINDRPL